MREALRSKGGAPMRVLLIEDTPRLAEAVAEILRKSGYGADIAHIGADGLAMALTGAYDAVLLDIMLPDMSGMDVLRELREAGSVVPVILLTARQGVGDRVAGLDAGADDYLPKPFHASELLARIRAVTRRPATYRPNNAIEACGLVLDVSSNVLSIVREGATSLTASAGVGAPAASVELTPREALLLEAFMNRARQARLQGRFGRSAVGASCASGREPRRGPRPFPAREVGALESRRGSRRCAVWDIASFLSQSRPSDLSYLLPRAILGAAGRIVYPDKSNVS